VKNAVEKDSLSGANSEEFPRVYVILLNWNGWRDTIECLESIFRNDYPNFRVIVCDNCSTDNSLSHIRAWADGQLSADCPTDDLLRSLTMPPIPKPVRYQELDREAAEKGEASDAVLTLIHTGANLGFAGGNNVGLRYAMAKHDFEYVWILNNDTVIQFDALTHLVKRMQGVHDAGICGSTLLYYGEPETVQGLGGATYNKWLGFNRPVGFLGKLPKSSDPGFVEQRMQYVIGASMLVTREFLQVVGLMNEEYFLFFEEIDWAVRARARFRLVYSPGSIVYHKEGRSSGIHLNPKMKGEVADYFLTRNRLGFTRKYYPFALPTVYLGLLVSLFNRIRRGQWARVGMILDLMMHPGKWVS
jgi:hypothetical protein